MKTISSAVMLILAAATISFCGDFKAGTAGSLTKIGTSLEDINKVSFEKEVYLETAKDESESFQVIIIPEPAETVENLTVNFDKAEFEDNNITLKWHKVVNVKTGNPCYPVEKVNLVPDVLMPAEKIDVAENNIQPIWFSAVSSPNTKAGIYRTKIIFSSKQHKEVVNLTVRVRDFTIPRPGTLAAPFGLYRWVLEEWYYGKRDTLKQKDYLRWSKFLAEYRLTPKEIGLEYVKRQYDTINGRKQLTSVDMSALNPYLKRLDEKYFPPYSMQLYRLQSGPTVEKGLKSGAQWCTPENIAQPVKLHVKEWKKQGLSDKVYIYGIDEAKGEDMYNLLKDTYKLIKDELPEAKIMQTGHCNKPEMVGLIDIWCPKTDVAWLPFFQQRLEDGDILWLYVCCSPTPPYANFLVDQEAIDHRMLFWQTRELGATGFLYWTVIWHTGIETKAYNNENAFPESLWDFSLSNMFTDKWVHVNGDGMLVYPGKNLQPLPSIRLEIVRDGIEDYEYMALLENLTEKVKKLPQYQTKGTKPLINKAQRLCRVPDYISSSPTSFTKNREDILQRRKEIADMIEQIKDILENKDYLNWKE